MTDDGLVVLPAEPLARHTPWRTGGRCDAYVVAFDEASVIRVMADCRAVSWATTLLGGGTRAVFRDGDVPGVVLRLSGGLAQWTFDGDQVHVGGGAPVPALVAAGAQRGLSGLEGFVCTPGTVGAAALFDDAWGAVVMSGRTILRDKVVVEGLPSIRRRKSSVVLGLTLQLTASTPAEVLRRTDAAWRQMKPTPPGSWYEAPKKGSVRAMLQSVQLPLVRLRRVAIPDGAPECLVNLGQGTAADMALLHRSAIDRVKKVRGLDLAPAIRWVGGRERALEGHHGEP